MPIVLRWFNFFLAPVVFLGTRWFARRHPEKYGPDGWRERFGDVPARSDADRRPCAWIHCVSVGEVHAARSLVGELQRALPRHDVVLSVTTRTGHEAALRNHPDRFVFFYPLDFPWIVRRVLDRVRPAIILLMELEVWPNLLAEAGRRGIPVCVVNGRVTEERSMRRFRRPVVRGLARWMFSRLTWIAAQDETYAARFRELGAAAQRVHVVGSLKYDTAEIADTISGDAALAAAMGLRRDRPIWVAGSTGPGEEAILLDALAEVRRAQPQVQLVFVPRKPERFEEVARLIEQRGFACIRRSARPNVVSPTDNPSCDRESLSTYPLHIEGEGRVREPVSLESRQSPSPQPSPFKGEGVCQPSGEKTAPPACVWLGDTMGELRKFYALADVAFIGRSLVPMGGSDPIEAAALGKPLLFGPHMDNFSDAARQLLDAGAAAQVRGTANGSHGASAESDVTADGAASAAADVAREVAALLADPAAARLAGATGRAVVRAHTGATRRTVERITATLGGE